MRFQGLMRYAKRKKKKKDLEAGNIPRQAVVVKKGLQTWCASKNQFRGRLSLNKRVY